MKALDTKRSEKDAAKTIDDEIVAYFMRHLVPVYLTFEKGTESHSAIMTSFVLSVANQWFLVSAGHCLKEIEENIRRGYKITKCLLVDSLGQGARHYDPIPFRFEDSLPSQIVDKAKYDYGFMILSPYYRRLLEKNNIQPLNEEVWKRQPTEVDFYALIGLPQELSTVTTEDVEVAPIMARIDKFDKRPDGFSETDDDLFYGKIFLGDGPRSIKGMSGGPIFAFRREPNGQLRYWLIALQGSWFEKAKYVCAYPTRLLGDVLEKLLE